MSRRFSYKVTNTNIYAHLLYRIHEQDAVKLDKANLLGAIKKAIRTANHHLQHKDCNIVIYAEPQNGTARPQSEHLLFHNATALFLFAVTCQHFRRTAVV